MHKSLWMRLDHRLMTVCHNLALHPLLSPSPRALAWTYEASDSSSTCFLAGSTTFKVSIFAPTVTGDRHFSRDYLNTTWGLRTVCIWSSVPACLTWICCCAFCDVCIYAAALAVVNCVLSNWGVWQRWSGSLWPWCFCLGRRKRVSWTWPHRLTDSALTG